MFNKRIPFLTERFRFPRITPAQRTVFHFSGFEGGLGNIYIYSSRSPARRQERPIILSRGCVDTKNQAILCIFESTDLV